MDAMQEEVEVFPNLEIIINNLTLIQTPEQAKELLLGSPGGTIRERHKLNQNSLLYFYFEPGPQRKYKNTDNIVAMAQHCENFSDSADPDEHIRNTIRFLGLLSDQFDPKFGSEDYRIALARFLHLNFKTPDDNVKKMEGYLIALKNGLNAKLPAEKRFMPFYKYKTEKMSAMESIVNYFSEIKSEKETVITQMGPYLFVSKKPNFKNKDEIMQTASPTLIISVLTRKEFNEHHRGRKTISQPFWAAHDIRNISIVIEDFGKPHRGNKKYTPDDLDNLARDCYYACVLAAETMEKLLKVLIHCKAGQGRSVIITLTLLRLIQAGHLKAPIDPKTPKEAKEILREFMAVRRTQINKDDETIRAATDIVEYIVQNLETLRQTTPHDHFARRYEEQAAVSETLQKK